MIATYAGSLSAESAQQLDEDYEVATLKSRVRTTRKSPPQAPLMLQPQSNASSSDAFTIFHGLPCIVQLKGPKLPLLQTAHQPGLLQALKEQSLANGYLCSLAGGQESLCANVLGLYLGFQVPAKDLIEALAAASR